jgi:hypothetical protein
MVGTLVGARAWGQADGALGSKRRDDVSRPTRSSWPLAAKD